MKTRLAGIPHSSREISHSGNLFKQLNEYYQTPFSPSCNPTENTWISYSNDPYADLFVN
jgi:hypothetical protein